MQTGAKHVRPATGCIKKMIERMAEVSPCPFCGSAVSVYCYHRSGSGGELWLAECSSLKCDVDVVTSSHPNKEAALAAWNRRVEPAVKESLTARPTEQEALPRNGH